MLFAITLTVVFGQTKKDTAITNFESFFTSFKNSYPADKNKYSFNNYSDLWIRRSIPEELKMMIAYDTSNFYSSYLYAIKHTRDTLIKISEINISQEVKDLYIKFRQSIIKGGNEGKRNYKQDQEYSAKLKRIVNQTSPPFIGYYQTVTELTKSPDGQAEENIIVITYSNNLDVIEFGNKP